MNRTMVISIMISFNKKLKDAGAMKDPRNDLFTKKSLDITNICTNDFILTEFFLKLGIFEM